MSSKEEDCSWVFDSLVGFLQGPVWNAPILTFIEQKSSSSYRKKAGCLLTGFQRRSALKSSVCSVYRGRRRKPKTC
ncbi:unnamed protein product [Timema podura]|uniref:BART domain-containing protein n=1 Tax=Timema podura TaxID=61482 RepID=A0ABN7P7P6_TIMPD|nr:unnamed protein product [Timema podura]